MMEVGSVSETLYLKNSRLWPRPKYVIFIVTRCGQLHLDLEILMLILI
jgi:hypothetical protein